MHNNYYFLRKLSDTLGALLKGYSIVSCFSQNKDELVLELNNEKESFFIKAYLQPTFSCLSFPASFHRAKKNSVDLFDELVLKKCIGTTQYENERSFSIDFSNGYSLIFKMHGNRSNVLLSHQDKVVKIFRNQFLEDLSIIPSLLHKRIDWSESAFLLNEHSVSKHYFTFGKPIWNYLESKNFSSLPVEKKFGLILETIKKFEDPEYFIVQQEDKIILTLFPTGSTLQTFQNPVHAINEFFHLYISSGALESERQVIIKKLTQNAQACEAYIEKNVGKLKEIEYDSRYKSWADLLMANIYQIPKGSREAKLEDFTNQPITIPLKPNLSIQKNAEIYYRKSKNQDIEINKLFESIEQKKAALKEIKVKLRLAEGVNNLKELRTHFPSKEATVSRQKQGEKVPFYEVEFKGFKIWIGKSADNNDELTQKYAHKDDLWLHVKDVAGSHVVIKHQSNKPFPKEVIERAAELAAYNSKRKTETLCAVVYTPKKFVRKRKGDLPGSVVVEKEIVIMVSPRL